MQTANFDFLELHDAKLVQLGGLAERYFPGRSIYVPVQAAAICRTRRQIRAAHQALYVSERETFEERSRRLGFERAIPR